MTNQHIAYQRLRSQSISVKPFQKPEDIVRWMGAVQAQDYYAGKWAVGLRLNGVTDEDVEQALDRGAILRTHVLRPTWHMVCAEDIRWMLALSAPRVNAFNASYYRRMGLDEAVFAQSRAVLTRAMEGGRQLTRGEVTAVLKQAGLAGEDALRSTLLVMRAELDGVICSGARRGKQITYALLDERVPKTAPLEKEAALAELARRYFTSRGPATLQDFAWWSGLSAAEAKAGLELVQGQLAQETLDGKTGWLADSPPVSPPAEPNAYLLPNYDEYTVGYTERGAVFDEQHRDHLSGERSSILTHVLVINGLIAGVWKPTREKNAVSVTIQPFTPLTEAENQAVGAALRAYSEFIGLPVMVAARTE